MYLLYLSMCSADLKGCRFNPRQDKSWPSFVVTSTEVPLHKAPNPQLLSGKQVRLWRYWASSRCKSVRQWSKVFLEQRALLSVQKGFFFKVYKLFKLYAWQQIINQPSSQQWLCPNPVANPPLTGKAFDTVTAPVSVHMCPREEGALSAAIDVYCCFSRP